MEYGYALRLNLPMATLENKDGVFVESTPQSGAAALASTEDVQLTELEQSTADPRGQKSYPPITYSWILLDRDYPVEKAGALKELVGFVLDEGQSYAPYFGYLPLPSKVVEKSRSVIDRLNDGGVDAVANAGLDGRPGNTNGRKSRQSF